MSESGTERAASTSVCEGVLSHPLVGRSPRSLPWGCSEHGGHGHRGVHRDMRCTRAWIVYREHRTSCKAHREARTSHHTRHSMVCARATLGAGMAWRIGRHEWHGWHAWHGMACMYSIDAMDTIDAMDGVDE